MFLTDCNLATECSNTGTNYESLLPFMVHWTDTGHNEVRSVTRRKIPEQNFVNIPWAVLNMKYDNRLTPVISDISAHFQWTSHMQQSCSWQSSYDPLYDNPTYAWISLQVFRLTCWTYFFSSSQEPCMLPASRSPRFGNLIFSLGNAQTISHAFCYFSSRYQGSPQNLRDVFALPWRTKFHTNIKG